MKVHRRNRWRRTGPRFIRFKIREWRIVRDMTQEELAYMMDTSKASICRWENWTREEPFPSLSTLERFAKALKVGIKDLFEE